MMIDRNKSVKIQCMHCMGFFDEQFDVCPYCGADINEESGSALYLNPGTLLDDRYTVGVAIGSGGFGVTYVGYDRQLGRKVAIKEYLPSEFSSRLYESTELLIAEDTKKREQYQKGLRRFVSEGKKLAQIVDIDGIVRIHDILELNNTAYLIMEYLDGESLESYIKREGKLSEEDALNVILPVLRALGEVHKYGLIHRDLSPDNIFLATDDDGNIQPKIIDFGSAKFATTTHSRSLTVTIKRGYSPEEQYRSDGSQGTYTDIYAAGAVLYYMVTGIVPPDALERWSLLESKRRDLLKRPRKYNRNLSKNVEIAILNAMISTTENRTKDAEGFIKELTSERPVKLRSSGVYAVYPDTWPKWAKIVVPVLGVASFIFLIYVFTTGTDDGGTFGVPDGYIQVIDLYGKPYAEAEAISTDDQFLLNTIGRNYVPGAVGNIIVSQSIPAGSIVPVNTTIDVVVSADEAWYHMPPVLGMSIEDARDALECMGVQIDITEEVAQGFQSGCVISQSVVAFDRIKQGTTVTLVVATSSPERENDTIKAPDVVGLTMNEAVDVARTVGCSIYVEEFVYTDIETDQTVLHQNVNAGSELEEGSLGVVISYHNREFILPNLMYITISEARQLLKNIGIVISEKEEYSDNITKNLVYLQSVDAETSLETGSAVELTYSKGRRPFEMPNVVGLSEEEAKTVLEDAGLIVSVAYEYDDKNDSAVIINQEPSVGDMISMGEVTHIVVLCNEGITEVPDVVGLAVQDAKNELESLGFNVSINNEGIDATKPSYVVSQDFQPGTYQKNGGTILIETSLIRPKVAYIASNTDVGDIIEFGTYEQDGNPETDDEPIEWIVIGKETDRLLIVSRFILEGMPYHNTKSDVTWEMCTLRGWLNNEFYITAFNEEEKLRISETHLINRNNTLYGTPGGNDTIDKVFCLSIDELRTYYYIGWWEDETARGSCQDLIIEATTYALRKNLNPKTIDEASVNNWNTFGFGYTKDCLGMNGVEWWLRNPGYSRDGACAVAFNGSFGEFYHHYFWANTVIGVRPALWVTIGD